ncbi:MAG: copper transporter, partial [Aeromicrobium sp.]
MITFRYHLVSIAAIFLALAIGIALGSGPLDNAKNLVGNDSTPSASVARSDLVSFDAAYARKTGTSIINGKLRGQSVLIFTLPGARAAQVKGVKSAMTGGGATVTGEVALTSKLLDSTSRQFAEGVAQQAAKGANGVAATGDSYVRIGSALGRAFLSKKT